MANWEWHYDFIKLAADKQANAGHKAITQFQEYCAKQSDMDSMLITQNIDDFHS
jgi:NAD-dependent SIR2 family protein deacetylase